MKKFLLVLGFLPFLAGETLAEEAKKPSPPPAKEKKKKGPEGSIVNQAFSAIKEERSKIVDTYVQALLRLAEDCAQKGLVKAGLDITDRILKVVEPPKTRRKVRSKGVGVGLDKKGDIQVVEVEPVVGKTLTPAEEEKIEGMRKRVAAIRERLQVAAAGDPGRPSESPPSPAGDGGRNGEEPRTVVKSAEKPSEDGKAKDSGKKSVNKEDKEVYQKEASARKAAMRSVEKLAKSCVKQGFPAHGYEVLLWAIDLDPDNEDLRKLVRQHAYTDKEAKKRWYGPFELQKAKAGYIDHPEYGWVTPAEITGLQSGKLYYQNKWQPREFVEAERQKWENRWTYETEHYSIDTNAPLRDAVEFGREVERLYTFFFRMFYDFYTAGTGPDPQLVFGGGKDLGNKKLKMNYYRSRESYISEVKKDKEMQGQPPSEMELVSQSAGFYSPSSGKAFFYRLPDGPDLSTIYHEATHQIFGETYNKGPRAPTWLVEGFGVFMEDPLIRGERLIAGAEHPPGVRKNNVRDINDFVKNQQNHEGFHSGPLRGSNYATSGALVHFFLFYKGGLYRQAFMKYAREAYRNTGDDSPTHIRKLYEYLGIAEAQFQKEWEEFNQAPDLFDF